VANGIVCAAGALAIALVLKSIGSSDVDSTEGATASALGVVAGITIVPAVALSVINARGLRAADGAAHAALRRVALVVAGLVGALMLAVAVCVMQGGGDSDALALGALAVVMPVFALILAVLTVSGLGRAAREG
jgi:hypothetical protein